MLRHRTAVPFLVIAFMAVVFASAATLPAQEEKPALVFENGGLKNMYRVVFAEWDEKNSFARGVIEVQGNDSEEPEFRLPFAVELKPSKDKKTEILEVRCTASLFFFPPTEKKEPYPTLTWALTGRKSGKAVLKARLWEFNADKGVWALEEMELKKAQE